MANDFEVKRGYPNCLNSTKITVMAHRSGEVRLSVTDELGANERANVRVGDPVPLLPSWIVLQIEEPLNLEPTADSIGIGAGETVLTITQRPDWPESLRTSFTPNCNT